ncbi:hypothetical protein DPMN_167414 [Dreissena polymorpha]|uniref:Uncharacterized protein n=1 Tax=Dreissena polymorpha TaxID=45954 RepID=A0A9D4F0V3_DREPO|nr:hypothetical protein DPMN_167414 [Dreissena polymorpha]
MSQDSGTQYAQPAEETVLWLWSMACDFKSRHRKTVKHLRKEISWYIVSTPLVE